MAPLRQDFVGGLAIIGVSAFAYWQGRNLPVGTLGGMGPGMLPKAALVLLASLGALLVFSSIRNQGPRLDRWTWRGPLFVLGAIVAFGETVRPGGLVVAGPLAILIAACASPETRWVETIVFSIVMTAFCIGLFKLALGLPIPLAPWLLGY